MISSNESRQAPTNQPGWCDVIDLFAVSDTGDTAIASQFGVYPSFRAAALQACVWRPDRLPIVLVEADLTPPARLWEVRGSGLWAEHVCETPLDHWSYGLEAFALEIDDPGELLGRGHGARVPLGWELEFEATSPGEAADEGTVAGFETYRQHGRVHGLVLTKSGAVEFNGVGSRGHRWGPNAASKGTAVVNNGAGRNGRSIALPGPEHILWVDFSTDGNFTARAEPAPS